MWRHDPCYIDVQNSRIDMEGSVDSLWDEYAIGFELLWSALCLILRGERYLVYRGFISFFADLKFKH